MDILIDNTEVDAGFYFSFQHSSVCQKDSTQGIKIYANHCSREIQSALSYVGIHDILKNRIIKMKAPVVRKDHRLLVAKCNPRRN